MSIHTICAKRGFTLVELMLVVIIIGVLVAMVVPRMAGRSEEARVAVAKADIDLNIATAVKLYELDNGAFPSSLDALLSAPGDVKNWKGPYLEKEPKDPWGNDYKYQLNPNNRKGYDLWSTGRDGQSGTADDVHN